MTKLQIRLTIVVAIVCFLIKAASATQIPHHHTKVESRKMWIKSWYVLGNTKGYIVVPVTIRRKKNYSEKEMLREDSIFQTIVNKGVFGTSEPTSTWYTFGDHYSGGVAWWDPRDKKYDPIMWDLLHIRTNRTFQINYNFKF